MAAARNAGIADLTFHDLRHTCASWMVQNGAPLERVAEALRHKNIETTRVYSHLAPENPREAVNAINFG